MCFKDQVGGGAGFTTGAAAGTVAVKANDDVLVEATFLFFLLTCPIFFWNRVQLVFLNQI